MKITKEQISKKIHECHMEWANNIVALAEKHGVNGDGKFEFVELVSKIIDHAWAETRYGIYSHHNEYIEAAYYDKYLPIYGPMIEADMAESDEPEEKDPDDMDEDEYIDYISDLANTAHERSEGMER